MDKLEYRTRKAERESDELKFLMEQTKQLLTNPLIEFALGTLFIGYITRGQQSTLERLTGIDMMAGTWGALLTGVITAQQLSAALPYVSQAAPGIIQGLLK